jgi:ribokinase
LTKITVVGLGALNMDNIYQVERILEDGETVTRESASFPGGSAANTIYGLAKLGVSTGFIGAVGNDTAGRALLRDFHRVSVDTSQIRIKQEAKTGSTLCLSDKLNSRSIYLTPGANSRLAPEDLDLDYINQAAMLHVSSFVDDMQFQILLELMEKLGSSVQLSFSPGALYAARGLQALQPVLARTDIIFINKSEIRQLTGEDFKAGAQICLNQGCRLVVVTLGKGANLKAGTAVSYIKTADSEYMVMSSQPDTKPASDTTGAGDAFATGSLYGLLNGKNLEECGRFGDIVARFSIAQIGARQGLPTLGELAQRYRQLYNQQL